MGKHWQMRAADPAFVEMARSVADIPESQLARGPERDELIARALRGEVEAYTPLGSPAFNLWFERPTPQRIPLADWLLFRRLGHAN
jgi:hypothetical protein